MQKTIDKCRICGNTDLVPIIDLGDMAQCGRFLQNKNDPAIIGRLELVKCNCEYGDMDNCGLVQLRHYYDPILMYGEGYGYRSNLNASMASHLSEITQKALSKVKLNQGDIILDIGSNDGTLLKSYPQGKYNLIGIDSSGKQFVDYYEGTDIDFYIGFFDKNKFKTICGTLASAKIITSIAMFYDLDRPMEFMQEIADILDKDGIWITEQSYWPDTVHNIAYDMIVHEHTEQYSLRQLHWMAQRVGLKIIDIEFNKINGSSFIVTFAHERSHYSECMSDIIYHLQNELDRGIDNNDTYVDFKNRVYEHRQLLTDYLTDLKRFEYTILGYGASTKGNTLLQFCGIDSKLISAIAEVNTDKFGCYTPGSKIKIISEEDARSLCPDYYLVLPWHFRESIINREREFIERGGKFIFPLPKKVEIYHELYR